MATTLKVPASARTAALQQRRGMLTGKVPTASGAGTYTFQPPSLTHLRNSAKLGATG